MIRTMLDNVRRPAIAGALSPAAATARASDAVTIGVLSLIGLLIVSQVYVTIPLAPVLADHFNRSTGAAAWTGTVFGLGYALGMLIWGPLSDARGRRALIVPGMVALAATTLLVGLSPSFEALIGARAVQGIAAAMFAPAALAYLGEALPGPRRATGIAFMTSGFLLAGILGQVYASALADGPGWRWTFVLGAAIYALFALVAARTMVATRPAGNAGVADAFAQMRGLVRRARLMLVYAAAATVLFSFVAMYVALGPHLVATEGLDNHQLILVRLAGLPAMLLAPLAGRPIMRFGARRVVIAGLLLAAIGLGLEAAAGHLAALLVASGVFVAGVAVTVPALIALVSGLVGPARGAGLALYAFVLFIGASLAPVAVDAVGLSFSALLAVLAGVAVAAAGAIQLATRGA